jgi:hypothetical protein
MYTAQHLISVASAEVGYFEKKSLEMLDRKVANAGSGNYTKYARDLYNAGYYNGSKQGFPWCSVFVDWCHYMAAEKNKAEAQRVSCQSGPYGAGCGYSMGYYKAAGQFYTKDPKPGDQIYFGSASSVDHTGLVVAVDKERVYTIEGNTSGQEGVVSNGGGVFKKSYLLTSRKILGYGRPKFAQENSEQKKGEFTLEMRVLKNGCKGEDVKALQSLLIGNGWNGGTWGADGNFGAETEAAVFAYQHKNGLQEDGKAGPETMKSLLGVS